MSSGKTKQIFSLLKWRKGKKLKNEEKSEISDDLDCGSCQFKQEPSLFGRSQSEDSGLDLSNPISLYQKTMAPDLQENNGTHSRHTSCGSSLHSYLSYDSKSRQLPRSLSFTALSSGENPIKAAQSPTNDDVFGLQNIAQTYNLARLTNAGKCDLGVADISRKETEKEDGYKMNSNTWGKENKSKTTEESDSLEVVGCHGQFRRSSLESKVMSRSATNQMQMGVLYRLCSLMEKIMELERDRMELLRQNNELKDQLTQSQKAQEKFLSCCTCDARTGMNNLHTVTQQNIFSGPLAMREKPTTETMRSPVSIRPSSAGVRCDVIHSQHQDTDDIFTPETLNLGSGNELHLCISRV
ncbi:uncharacterized protein [Narcine bancroftii]|uniref:uncharacterized protein isoform X2 n=1 Tax=Narcine bancroftii TaxID=1343680 RepID=UPI0038316A24